jgi:hypothetical protein
LLSKVLTLPSVFEFLVNTRDILRLGSTCHALKEALTNRPELFSNADFYQFERTALDFWKFLRSEKASLRYLRLDYGWLEEAIVHSLLTECNCSQLESITLRISGERTQCNGHHSKYLSNFVDLTNGGVYRCMGDADVDAYIQIYVDHTYVRPAYPLCLLSFLVERCKSTLSRLSISIKSSVNYLILSSFNALTYLDLHVPMWFDQPRGHISYFTKLLHEIKKLSKLKYLRWKDDVSRDRNQIGNKDELIIESDTIETLVIRSGPYFYFNNVICKNLKEIYCWTFCKRWCEYDCGI